MAYYDIYDGIISSGLILSIDDSMYISSNGTANSTTINSGGSMYIESGGTANDTTVNSGGSMYIESGGTANGTIVNSGGDMYIESGGTARKTIINSDAAISIHNNASASNITIHSAGILLLHGGNADLITIASGGSLYVSNGCSATNISWTPCEGSLTVNNGAHVTFADNISGVYFGSNNKLLSHTQSMSKKRIFDTTMYVMTGGIADSTSLQRGDMYIMSGGTAVNTDLSGCGKMIICSGGTADDILLNTGDVYVHSGGTATNVIWTPCQGHISVACGANVTFASSYSGVYFGSNLLLQSQAQSMTGKSISGTTCSMYVMSGGTADRSVIDEGRLYVYSEGIVNSTIVSGLSGIGNGSLCLFSGGKANNTIVSSGGRMFLESAYANNTTIYSGAAIYVSSGASANGNTVFDGTISILSGGSAENSVLNDQARMYVSGGKAINNRVNYECQLIVSAGGTAEKNAVSTGDMNIYSGSMANDTVVENGGAIYVYNGGEAAKNSVGPGGKLSLDTGASGKNTSVCSGGSMSIYGTAVNTVITDGGKMYIGFGGVHRRTLWIGSGAQISGYGGAYIDFTVSEWNINAGYLINDLSLIKGSPNYTITVNNHQSNGTYKLAQGASNFTGSLTIGNGSRDFGSISVNGADFVHRGVTYSLDQVGGNLTLTVSGAKAVADDLDGNGLADVILVHTKQGYSGAWLTTGKDDVIKWGSLSNVGNGVEVLGVGNVFNSGESGQDIFLKNGSAIAAWVMEEGKVKSYKGLYTLKSNMNLLGLGDFNGDGATDYLLRSTTGDLGYITSNDNNWHYIKGLGKEWKISAIGDLNGDGLADTVVRHDAGYTGAYMIDKSGKITWSNLDTLADDMTIVGAGDFNGDGVDDILLQNKSNGWVGAWLVEDGSVDSFIGLCNNKNSIEQIADFNGDGIDDLRIRAGADIGVLYVNGADDTTWQYFKSVGSEWETKFSALA